MPRKPSTIEFLKRVYKHPQYQAVHRVLEDVRKTSGYKAKIVVITARSGAGKSTACRRYTEKENEKAEKKSPEGVIHHPILYVSLDEQSTPLSITKELLRELGVKRPKGLHDDLRDDLRKKLKLYNIELIIIDEAHHVLPEHTSRKVQLFADYLKVLLDKSAVGIALVGMPKTLRIYDVQQHKNQTDEDREEKQLINRSRQGYQMSPYDLEQKSKASKTSYWVRILAEFENNLPVRALPFTDESNAMRLWLACSGYLGGLANLLEESLELLSEDEPLTLKALEQGFVKMHRNRAALPPNPFSSELKDQDLWAWYESRTSATKDAG
ncbi:transposase [Neiella marina]|uniref:Transposase n=1 Tax=Neiella marina TaxID=508461 RepID=A0A8J2XPJ3_9GAMM|nr:ATP-binding protein [Neiella marina]GGA77292.1 transposase [Neiella marina]